MKLRRLTVAVYDENNEPIILGPVEVDPKLGDTRAAFEAIFEITWCIGLLGFWPIETTEDKECPPNEG